MVLSPKRIDLYLARGFLVTFFVVLAIVVTMLQSLDLMNQSDEILAAEGAGRAEIFRYIGWRAPQLADRFAPFVALLAALISFARLGRTSEITAMRAAGMSPLRVLAPVCVMGGLIALVHFALHEVVVVEANARLERWAAQDYAVDAEPGVRPIANIRLTDGDRIVRADSLAEAEDGVWRLENLRAYDLSYQGGIDAALRASAARHDADGWRLIGARRFNAAEEQWQTLGDTVWTDGPTPERIVASALDPEQANLDDLHRATRASRGESGAQRLETALMHRFTAPAASFIMPLLAAIAGFGLHRSNTLLARIVAGLGLGFSYFVFDNIMVVMGRLDTAPPVMAALAAPVVFAGVGLAIRK